MLGLDLPDFENFLFAGGHDDVKVDLKELNPIVSKEKTPVVKAETGGL